MQVEVMSHSYTSRQREEFHSKAHSVLHIASDF